MHPAKRQRRCQNHDIPRLQAIHRLLVAVETDKPAFRRHIHFIGRILAQPFVTVVKAILKDIGHGDQFDRAAIDAHGLRCRARPPTAATNQRHLNGVLAGGVNIRHRDPRQGGNCRDTAG